MTDIKEFITAWQLATHLEDVSDQVRIPQTACLQRARRYRNRGVPLRDLPSCYADPPREHQGKAKDWLELAAFAQALLQGKE